MIMMFASAEDTNCPFSIIIILISFTYSLFKSQRFAKGYAKRIENEDLPKEDGELTKLTDNFLKIMKSIEK